MYKKPDFFKKNANSIFRITNVPWIFLIICILSSQVYFIIVQFDHLYS